MPPFTYSRVSQGFISDLKDEVLRGNSVVLLGPRFGGKRHVIKRLYALLEDARLSPIVHVSLLTEPLISTAKKAREVIQEAVERAQPGFNLEQKQSNNLLDAVELLADHLGKPVVLMAANVDGMAHHLTRSFLQGVRTLHDKEKLIAVMSGEDTFRYLLDDDNSEFTCANQFVLQGYEEDEFNDCLYRYLRYTPLKFSPEQEVVHHLWNLTGGNIYTLRIILWIILQARTRNTVEPAVPVTIDEIPGDVELANIPGAYGAHIFHHATHLVESEPKCWPDLEKLINGQDVLTGKKNTPTPLELSGLVIRKEIDGVEQLVMASPLMTTFVRQYYDERRLGDLYGSIGKWEEAIERYTHLEPEARVRPSGADDRGPVEMLISALGASLQSQSTIISRNHNTEDVIESLKHILARGCYYVLGFREIVFWYRNSWQQSGGWEDRQLKEFTQDEFRPERKVLRDIQSQLPWDTSLPLGIQNPRDGKSRIAVVALLPALRRDQQVAVTVSDFEKGTVIARERERLVNKLLEHFINAYTHAVSIDGLRMRLRVRGKHIEIMNSIFNSLGSPQLSTRKVLTMAAQELRHLEYKRVVFSLIDPEKRTIEGVLEDSDKTTRKIFDKIRWALDDPTADLQPYVIHSKDFWIIKDAATDLYADRRSMAEAGIRTAAVVPILSPLGEAIGTILVERDNGAVPSNDEANDLKEFGRQLAIAIEQCERVNLLESCLNRIPEPLLIVDRKESQVRKRYQNRPAAKLFGGQTGWIDRQQEALLNKEEAGTIVDLIHESLDAGRRRAQHIEGIGRATEYQAEVIADTIQDWREKTVGGLLRIQDRTYLHKYFDADRRAVEATDVASAVRSMLEATQKLGHKWGRLYLVEQDKQGTEIFTSELSYGHADPEKEKRFNRHKVKLAPRMEGNRDWLCIVNRAPVVFSWSDERRDGEIYFTNRGLRVINWQKPEQPPEAQKQPGDFWMDFPLISGDKVLGKICLECSENLQPEQLELLNHLSITFAVILESALARERSGVEKVELMREAAARKTMATMAHNIGTRHGSIPLLLRRYRRMEKDTPGLQVLNDRFAYISEHILATIKRAKEFLSPVQVKRSPTNIVDAIRYILEADELSPISWRLSWQSVTGNNEEEGEPLIAMVDIHLFETALLEMIQNSREQVVNEEDLLVAITIIADRQRRDIEIIYQDNGPGVPPEFQKRIFEDLFSRRPNRETAGTGLGMGFISRVIEGHGGKISYEGEEGEGARFVITLPESIVSESVKEEIDV